MSTTRSKPKTRVSPALAGTLMTPEEFDAITDWDDRFRYELIRGVLVVVPPAASGERGPNEILGHLLLTYQQTHPQGHSLDLTLPENLVMAGDDRRRADRVLWAGLGRMPDPDVDLPTIAVEFVSRGRRNRGRDYLAKRDEYLAAGVEEYWIIDRFARRMTAVRRGQPDILVGEKDVYTTPLLPGFGLPLAQLLSVADLIEKAKRSRRKR